ncbi:MAG: hypothetical protein ACYCVY_09330 [Acidiferrobacteraceae bacterium]
MAHVADLPDRVPGECAWRDHLPAVDPKGLAALNRSGKNRVDNFLVLAFREIDKGRKNGLRWPSGWKNGAGLEVRRWADTVDAVRQHSIGIAQGLRGTLPELKTVIASLKKAETALKRGRPGAALKHLHAAQGNPWTPWELRTALRTPTHDHLPALRIIIKRTQKLHDDTKRGPLSTLAARFIRVSRPRKLLREQRVIALAYLVKAYRLDTERDPTLVSEDWRAQRAHPEGSFDAYLATFCRLVATPESAMRELFKHHKPQA